MWNWVYRLLSTQDSSQKTYSVCKLSVSLLSFLHILMSLLIVLQCNVKVRHFFSNLEWGWTERYCNLLADCSIQYQFTTLQSHNKLMLTLFNSHFSFSFSTSPPKTLVLFESSIRKFSLTVMVPVKEILVPGGIDKLLRNERYKHLYCSCFLNLSKTCIFCSINGFVFKCRHSRTLIDFLGNESFGRFKKSFLSVAIGKFWLVFAIILFLSSRLHIISS